VAPAQGPYERVREPAVAGSWYTDDPTRLAIEIDGYLDQVEDAADCRRLPTAVISPHAGYRFSGATAGHAYAAVRGCHLRRVWVLAPTHRLSLRGAALYQVDAFRTPLGDLPLDAAVIGRLAERPGFRMLPHGDGGEHSLEIQLPFLQRALGAFELVPVLVGDIDDEGATAIAEALRAELGPGDLVVVSTDFTHFGPRFGYVPFRDDLPTRLSELDHGAWAHVAQPDPSALHAYTERTGATICGRNPLKVLAALAPAGTTGTELAYTTSGELTGDWSNSVSYLAGRLDGPGWTGTGPRSGGARFVSESTATWLLDLAHSSLEHWYRTGTILRPDPDSIPADATKTLGAFVTLEKGGRLRGCIGEISPYREVWKAVTQRAVDAAIHDSRFPPVTEDELPELEIDVSLLGPSWTVPGSEAVIVGRHGVVLTAGSRRATFLPQVAPEQGWDRRTTLLRLAKKAGIRTDQLPRARIDVYEAQVVH